MNTALTAFKWTPLNSAPSGSVKREQRLEQLVPLSGFGAATDKMYPAELAAP